MAINEDTPMSASNLHNKLSIPYPYLRQILTNLAKNGFINSSRGRGGGFSINKREGDIFLADIIEATDGMDSLNRCILGFRECPFNKECSMHPVWESTRAAIIKILKETSLSDIAKKRD
jgi:Rrf2 family iron-sulfur cluster assembly transcriptional regulator